MIKEPDLGPFDAGTRLVSASADLAVARPLFRKYPNRHDFLRAETTRHPTPFALDEVDLPRLRSLEVVRVDVSEAVR